MASLRQLRNGDSDPSRNGWDDVQSWIQMAGASFPVHTTGLVGEAALPDSTVEAFAEVYKSNGIVAACMNVRSRIFSQVTFRYASLNNGKLGKLFGTPALSILEKPWPNGNTAELAARMIQDVDLAGNFYAVRRGSQLYRRDPAKTSIILSGDPAKDEFVDVLGYVYQPDGAQGPVYTYEPDEMCHWSPQPDPQHPYKGMSWLTPVLREIRSDNAASDYKAKFYGNAATPNMIVKFPPDVMNQDQFDRFKAKMEADYSGSRGAGKTLYLAPGADVEVVGQSFKELDFSESTGRDESRIASAAGVPAVIVGLKESLSGSSLNTGNYSAARRSFADGTMRPLYGSAAGALETIAPPPKERGAAKLWYDDTQVAFFREDRADAANIQFTRAQAMRQLVDAGWTPDSVNSAFEAEDMSLLVHSGLYSVQLQPAGSAAAAPAREAASALEVRSASEPRELHVHTHNSHTLHVPVGVEASEIRVDVQPSDVVIERDVQQAPVVNVSVEPTPVEIRNEVVPAEVAVTVEPAAVEVRNDVTVVPADVVLPRRRRRVVSDSKGRVVETIEEDM